MLLFVGAWALDTYVDKDSPFASVLLLAGFVSLLVFLASTDLADRIIWRRIANKLRPHLTSTAAEGEPSTDRTGARIAGNKIVAELRDIGMRLKDRIDQGPGWWWRDKHFLPTSEWEQMRDVVAGDLDLSQAWEIVSHAYARVDAVNRRQAELVRQEQEDEYASVGLLIEDADADEEDPGERAGFDDLKEARAAVGRAERDLSRALRGL
ncbi:MAG TPA: hypothetical protein VN732_08445 [Solirubrobacterales bacterium]|nr:hypothetical protein [Solirubrobacterales bacterium]